MTGSSNSEDGFTLVELLVSLALLSLMTVYALSAFSAMRDMSSLAERHSAQQEVTAVVRHLRDTISDARIYFETNSDGSQKLLFDGTATALSLVTVSDGQRERGGLYRVTYRLEDNGDLVSIRQLLNPHAQPEGIRVILLREVESLSFRYADATRQNGPWIDSWPPTDRLPNAVGVSASFKPDSSRQWPPLAIEVRTAE